MINTKWKNKRTGVVGSIVGDGRFGFNNEPYFAYRTPGGSVNRIAQSVFFERYDKVES